MKQILFVFAAAGLLALSSCNNEAENAKLMEADAAKVQAEVDNRMAALQAEADSICNDMVNAAAQAAVDSMMAAAKKGGKKPAPKPQPAPPKVDDPKGDKMKGNTSNVEDKKAKMEGKSTEQIIEDKKKKMSGGK